jgi:hypothetical protein
VHDWAAGDMVEGKKSVQETCVEIDRLMNAAITGR